MSNKTQLRDLELRTLPKPEYRSLIQMVHEDGTAEPMADVPRVGVGTAADILHYIRWRASHRRPLKRGDGRAPHLFSVCVIHTDLRK